MIAPFLEIIETAPQKNLQIGPGGAQAGNYVGRIVKGEKPSELPVTLPTKFQVLVNLKTAKSLGIDIPATVLARAEGNMCGTAMRGAVALPGSKATSRAKGSHRMLGGLASGRQMLRERDGPHREGRAVADDVRTREV